MYVVIVVEEEEEEKRRKRLCTYSAYDVLVVSEVCLAALAAVDLVAVEVGVVCEAHDVSFYRRSNRLSWFCFLLLLWDVPPCLRVVVGLSPPPNTVVCGLSEKYLWRETRGSAEASDGWPGP